MYVLQDEDFKAPPLAELSLVQLSLLTRTIAEEAGKIKTADPQNVLAPLIEQLAQIVDANLYGSMI